jgi:hypothetical protein
LLPARETIEGGHADDRSRNRTNLQVNVPFSTVKVDVEFAQRFLRDQDAAEIQPAVAGLGFEQGLVLLPLTGSEEMYDVLPAGMQELCDQAPVATPPKGLRAHEAGRRLRQRRGERRLPPLSAHAGGIAAEGGDAKTAEGILARLTGEAAAKLDRVPIGDPPLLEHRCESWSVELGVVTRAREASHIDQGADAGLAYNGHEFFSRPSPMPDRPDDHHTMVPGWMRSARGGNVHGSSRRRSPSPKTKAAGSGLHDHARAGGLHVAG